MVVRIWSFWMTIFDLKIDVYRLYCGWWHTTWTYKDFFYSNFLKDFQFVIACILRAHIILLSNYQNIFFILFLRLFVRFIILSRILDRAYTWLMMQGRNRTQQLTVNSMLLKRVRHRVERPLLVTKHYQ
jgi:hypothetical protein